jgi:hypothetical protein
MQAWFAFPALLGALLALIRLGRLAIGPIVISGRSAAMGSVGFGALPLQGSGSGLHDTGSAGVACQQPPLPGLDIQLADRDSLAGMDLENYRSTTDALRSVLVPSALVLAAAFARCSIISGAPPAAHLHSIG